MRPFDFPNRALVSSRTPNGTFLILFLVQSPRSTMFTDIHTYNFFRNFRITIRKILPL